MAKQKQAATEANRGGLMLATKNGKRRTLVGAPPALAGTRPGDVLFGPLSGSTAKAFLFVENFFFWTGTAWENSGTIVELSDTEATDIKQLSKARRRFLKVYGYL